MDIVKRLNEVIDYIETNIESDISITKLANIAHMNKLHFQSLFSIVTGITITEYIRKRRLSLAAEDLQKGLSVTEATYKYGYSSPDSFTRAFRKVHGINPSLAKRESIKLITHPKISIQISIRGVKEMNFKIVEKDAFRMYGMERIINNTDDSVDSTEIPEFWNQVMNDGSFKKLLESTNEVYTTGDYLVNGVMCYDGRDMNDTFPYAIAAFETEQSNTEGFKTIDIPAYKWVIFTTDEYKPSETVEHIQALWRRIYTEWLPSVEYKIIDGPNIEVYGSKTANLEYSEVWLPIEKL